LNLSCNELSVRSHRWPSQQDLTDSPDTQKIKAQLVDMQGSQIVEQDEINDNNDNLI
jgi:hypothetical protein